MTDADIITAFEAAESVQRKTPHGQDYPAILRELAEASGRTVADVRGLILDAVLARPN